MVVSRVLLSLWLLISPAAAECWGANTDKFPACAGYSQVGYSCSGNMCARSTCVGCSACTCNSCAVHYPSAVLDEAEGVCCASVSNGTCVGPKSGDNPPSDDDDIWDGNEPEEVKQSIIFLEFAAWSSCIAAGSLLTMHLLYVPETRRQMRPRMLLVLLAFDFLAGLFFGMNTAPVFVLSKKYDNGSDSTNVDNIFQVLG